MIPSYVLERIGALCLCAALTYVIYCLSQLFFTYILGPILNKVDFASKGQWAVVTGCTDGIGKEYAKELAARGCDIVLISRSLDKLKATAEEIENEFKVRTKIIQVDFSDGEAIYEKIEKEVEGLEIGTLVNNVGVSYDYPEYFLDMPNKNEMVDKLSKTNCISTTRMTSICMPSMMNRRKGIIINISSVSSLIPSPMLTAYAASKAYIAKFTEGLEMEYGRHGIIIQCVFPGFVCSNMSGIRRSSLFAPTAKEFVHSAIRLVGTTTRTTGYLPHALFMNTINTIHAVTGPFAVWLVRRSMETSRRKALKKYKKQ